MAPGSHGCDGGGVAGKSAAGAKSLERRVESLMRDVAELVLYQDPAAPRVDARGLPLVLISQVARSGGTLLSQLFDGHPNLLAFPHELKWGYPPKHAWPSIDPADGAIRAAGALIAGNAKNLREFNLHGYRKAPQWPDGPGLPHRWSYWRYVEVFCDEWERRAPATRRDCLDIFMGAYFSAFHQWRAVGEKRAVTAFTPGVSMAEPRPQNLSFFADYPDGLLVCLCRHPVAWFASASRHAGKYRDPDAAFALWAESARSACALQERYADRMVLLSFENLVERPRQVMAGLAQRIGVSFDEILLQPTFNGYPLPSNSSFDPKTGIDPGAIDRSAMVPAELRAKIEREQLPLYRRFCDIAQRF